MKVLRIIIKDLKLLLGDKEALAILILMPIILTSILSFSLKGMFTTGSGMNSIKVAVVKNYDKNEEYNKFVSTIRNGFFTQGMDEKTVAKFIDAAGEFDAEEIFFQDFLNSEDIMKVLEYQIEPEEEAVRLLKEKEISAVIVLPEDFIYGLYINVLTPFRNNVEIEVIGHPDRVVSSEVVQYITEIFSNTLASAIIGKNVILEAAMEHDIGDKVLDSIEDTAEKISEELASIKVNVNSVKVEGKKSISSFDYYAAAMLAMFILFAASQGGRTLLEEKQNTTYDRMAVSGVSKLAILTGKFFTVFITALIQMIIMITYSSVVLKVYWGDAIPTLLICMCSAFAVAGAGILISVLTFTADNYNMANAFENVIIQVMALLGGSYFPIDVLPSFMRKLSVFSINGLALKSYLKIMMDYGLREISGYLISLTAAGIIFCAAAVLIFYGRGGSYNVNRHQTKTAEAA